MNLFKKLVRGEEAASMVEYGLLVALIAIAALVAVTAVGTSLSGMFTSASTAIKGG